MDVRICNETPLPISEMGRSLQKQKKKDLTTNIYSNDIDIYIHIALVADSRVL